MAVTCATCGGSGQTNFGGWPNICISCGGTGVLNVGPSSSGSSNYGHGRSSFVAWMNLCGLILAVYLVWPVESWQEGLTAGILGILTGGFLGGLVKTKNIGRYIVDAFWTLVRVSFLLAGAGALIYFIKVT